MSKRILEISAIDASLLKSFWGSLPLKASEVRAALEIDEEFELRVFQPYREKLAAKEPEKKNSLLEIMVKIPLSEEAVQQLREAWKIAIEKETWSRAQVKQIARISEALDSCKAEEA